MASVDEMIKMALSGNSIVPYSGCNDYGHGSDGIGDESEKAISSLERERSPEEEERLSKLPPIKWHG